MAVADAEPEEMVLLEVGADVDEAELVNVKGL